MIINDLKCENYDNLFNRLNFKKNTHFLTERYVLFSKTEIDEIETASKEIHKIYEDISKIVIYDNHLLEKLGIPRHAWNAMRHSFETEKRNIIGRIDFMRDDSDHKLKLIEYNVDSPNLLYESSVIQWFWFEENLKNRKVPSDSDQFNMIHQNLLNEFHSIKYNNIDYIHISHIKENKYDDITINYLRDLFAQAHIVTIPIDMEDIGYDPRHEIFVDMFNKQIKNLFRLYPIEWIWNESFSKYENAMINTNIYENLWKILMENKGVMALIWERYAGHENLLPTYFEDMEKTVNINEPYVQKPLYSRQGKNIWFFDKDHNLVKWTDGPYSFLPSIIQKKVEMREETIIGSWMIGDIPSGVCVRIPRWDMTSDNEDFLPHIML